MIKSMTLTSTYQIRRDKAYKLTLVNKTLSEMNDNKSKIVQKLIYLLNVFMH